MLTALALLAWTLVTLAVGGAVGYRRGYTDGWTAAGRAGYETLAGGRWLGGGDRGE